MFNYILRIRIACQKIHYGEDRDVWIMTARELVRCFAAVTLHNRTRCSGPVLFLVNPAEDYSLLA